MTQYTYPDLPEFIVDHVGQEVRPGDFIVYAVRVGNSAYMHSGYVQNFQFPKQNYSWNENELKIKVKDPLTERTSVILESGGRYAKVVLPDDSVLDSDQQ